jgi:hypothetical protein
VCDATGRRMLGADRLAEGDELKSNVLHFCAVFREASPIPEMESLPEQDNSLFAQRSFTGPLHRPFASVRPCRPNAGMASLSQSLLNSVGGPGDRSRVVDCNRHVFQEGKLVQLCSRAFEDSRRTLRGINRSPVAVEAQQHLASSYYPNASALLYVVNHCHLLESR